VLKAWNVTSQHGWAVIVQAPLKKSLGEMMKIHDKAVEKLFKIKNVTSVAILTHRLIVGTSNATDTGEEGQAVGEERLADSAKGREGERGPTQPPWRG